MRHFPSKSAASAVVVAPGLLIEPVLSQQEASHNSQARLYIPYQDYSQEDNERILQLFRHFRVSDVSDGMDVIGLADVGIVAPDIKPLWCDSGEVINPAAGGRVLDAPVSGGTSGDGDADFSAAAQFLADLANVKSAQPRQPGPTSGTASTR